MKINKRLLAICIAIPLLVGIISALLTSGSMENFATLNKPFFAPPAWLFPVAWTILYVLMGISSYLILTSGANLGKIEEAVNFLWPTIFFNLEWYFFAFLWLILLWVLVALMILKFKDISKIAAYLIIPYILWLTFAGILNLSIWFLNR